MNRADLTVGQDVIVRRASDKYKPVRPGRVVKIGRTLVTIQQDPDERYSPEAMFYIDTQQERNDYSPARFLTLEQHAQEEQRAAYLPRLRAHGFDVDRHDRPSTSTILAVVELLEGRSAQ